PTASFALALHDALPIWPVRGFFRGCGGALRVVVLIACPSTGASRPVPATPWPKPATPWPKPATPWPELAGVAGVKGLCGCFRGRGAGRYRRDLGPLIPFDQGCAGQ